MTDKLGKYEIIRTLGKGATADVYLAHDPDRDRQVAIKVIKFMDNNAAMSRRLRKIFATEDSIGRRLDHPNIVKVYDAVIERERAFLIMEFVDGGALDKFCARTPLLPMHRVISIIFKCCLALDHAYKQGVVHRDIKPANILIDANDNPKIADFGLGLLGKETGKNSTFVMGVGSPAYMSPEQVKDYPLDQKTDLYSLGVVLYQLLTGRLPFRAKNAGQLRYKIINTDAHPVCAIRPELPAGLDPIISKALEKDLYNRYHSGAAFAKDLSAVRYQMVDEDQSDRDQTRFDALRRLSFFAEFEDIELWEVLRVSAWKEISEKVTLIREGDSHRKFGVIVDGFVEVSSNGQVICRLGESEVVGEMAFLHPSDSQRHATVVTLQQTRFLEISSAALALSSDELQERFNRILLTKVLHRMREANKVLAKLGGQKAVQGSLSTSGLGLMPPLELL